MNVSLQTIKQKAITGSKFQAPYVRYVFVTKIVYDQKKARDKRMIRNAGSETLARD